MASKSKKRRRVLGASCILAALIIAGSSFAWFTSKDEVTNRLSANADYDVRIVESFAPPKNFLPGQVVDKDVYAVNTGSIGAFVKESIKSTMTLTQEKRVDAVTAKQNGEADDAYKARVAKYIADNELVKLTPAERYSVEAGSYLALRPDMSTDEKKATLGRQVVDFTDGPTKLDDYNSTFTYDGKTLITDFVPDENGLYVFRRTVSVNSDSTSKNLEFGMEDFTYDAYYYFEGEFYKVILTSVDADDVIDRADNGKESDGLLTAATYKFFTEEQKVVVPELSYDAQKHRLVAKVKGFEVDSNVNITDLGKTYDEKSDEYKDALIQLYDAVRKYEDMSANEKQKYLNYIDKLIAANEAEQTYVNELANYEKLKTTTNSALKELKDKIKGASTGDTLEKAAKDLYGDKYLDYRPKDGTTVQALDADTTYNGDTYSTANEVFGTGIADPSSLTGGWAAEDSVWNSWHTDVEACVDSSSSNSNADSKFKAYVDAKRAYETTTHLTDAAFIEELKAYCNAKAATYSWTASDWSAFTKIEEYADYLYGKTKAGNYVTNYIDDFVNWVGAHTSGNEKHHEYEKRAALLKAETEYNKAVELYNTMANQVNALQDNYKTERTLRNNSKDKLYGAAGVEANAKSTTEIDAMTTAELETAKTGWDTNSDYYKYVNAKYEASKAKDEYDAAKGATNSQNDSDATGAKYQVEQAEKAVANAKKALDNAKMAYEQGIEDYKNTGDIIIYVNLKNDTTVGGTKEQWQLLPVKTLTDNFADNTAIFYYTSILDGGKTSKMLIDSVELDENVTQYMYKSFDFDLDVKLDSVQVTTAATDKNAATGTSDSVYTGTATATELGATVTLSDPTDINTALNWTAVTP